MIKYRANIYFDGCFLHEGDVWDDEDDAEDEANSYIEDKLDEWKCEGILNEGDEDSFRIEMEYIEVEDKEDDENE